MTDTVMAAGMYATIRQQIADQATTLAHGIVDQIPRTNTTGVGTLTGTTAFRVTTPSVPAVGAYPSLGAQERLFVVNMSVTESAASVASAAAVSTVPSLWGSGTVITPGFDFAPSA